MVTAPHLAREAKRRRELITPEGLALNLTIASRGARAGAIILDFILIHVTMLVVTLLLMYLAFGVFGVSGMSAGGPLELLAVVWLIMMFLFRYAYFLYFELGPRGATPGKRITGIRIAARDGGRLTAEAVIARNLLRDIELFLPLVLVAGAQSGDGGLAGLAALAWFAIFMTFPFFNRDAMRAGDLVAGTFVVEAPGRRREGALDVSRAALGQEAAQGSHGYRFGEAELAVYGEYELQVLERILRDNRADAMVQVAETICAKIGWTAGRGDERAFLEAFYAQLRARLESDLRFGKRKADKHAMSQ
jgi:uncharacterized RDD family membrane protein YckC